jgi:itaconate CoA-transferase
VTAPGSGFPLDGVRVIALEQAVAAPLCTRHLADLGADVIKIERPGTGDFARTYDSVVEGQSAHFVWLNRAKRSVVLDLAAAEGRETLALLLGSADVFVHNLGPGAVDRLGFGSDVVEEKWPSLVTCAISGYGADGPYRDRKAFDLLVQGESGVISVTGTPAEPAKVGISIADISAAIYALSAILAALHRRDRTGRGAFIDISLLECLAEWMMPPAYHQIYTGSPPERAGMRHGTIVPYGPFVASDGVMVNLAVQNQGQWERLCGRVLDRSDLAVDRRFRTNEDRLAHRGVLEAIIATVLSMLPSNVVRKRLDDADVPFGDVNDVADLVAHPQLIARDKWFEVDTPHGPIRALSHPMNLSGMPRRIGRIAKLGEHTGEVVEAARTQHRRGVAGL